jgi:hypothetical protein
MRPREVPLIAGILLMSVSLALAENMDPYDDGSQYAYGLNIGWLDFEPNEGPGVTVSGAMLSGYVWGENIGWINLSPVYGGVVNDGTGLLSGYAWGQNVGWINFNPKVPADPTHYGVTIDDNGNFDGWAWGQNIGWICFQSSAPVAYKVRTCVVRFDDLANFADEWLSSVLGSPADLVIPAGVDERDYAAFASYWHDYCPDGWRLK